MNILLVSKRLGCSTCITFGQRSLLSMVLVVLVIPVIALYFGYRIGTEEGAAEVLAGAWQDEVTEQREAIAAARKEAEENLNALTLRLGQMQAHVIRLDALGQRLTRMAGLENGEFDFSTPPAQGGPETVAEQETIGVPDFVAQLDQLSRQLDDRHRQLNVLETMLMNRNLQAEVLPAGRPINSGWLSSHFGWRNDPFTGKKDYHKGVDLAGKEGTEVIAVASGVITWAGPRYGYGNLVEINHGSGYATRYGHNRDVLVKVGDTVKKGQSIAHMGNTGRSTGPHVHFEVLVDGKAVNPAKYIQAAR